MPTPSTDREALIAMLAEEAWSGGAHGEPGPEPEELLDYLAGRLAPEAAQRLERQLVADPDAAQALLDVAELDAAGETAGRRPAEISVLAGWRELKGRLPGSSSWFQHLKQQLPGIAASLLIATALGGYAGNLRREVGTLHSELRQPIPNLRDLPLNPLSRAGQDETPKVPAGPWRLVLEPDDRCPTYTLRLQGPSGDSQTIEGLKLDAENLLTPQVPLEPGPYEIHLSCGSRELDEYRIQAIEAHDN